MRSKPFELVYLRPVMQKKKSSWWLFCSLSSLSWIHIVFTIVILIQNHSKSFISLFLWFLKSRRKNTKLLFGVICLVYILEYEIISWYQSIMESFVTSYIDINISHHKHQIIFILILILKASFTMFPALTYIACLSLFLHILLF
jgi:hypothetical protein